MRILVYCPQKAPRGINTKWLYGIDIVERLSANHPEWQFVIVDGTIAKSKLYKNIDVLLRPTRHDGMPVMVLEARNLNIPVIWSYEKGYYEKPNIQKIEQRLIEQNKRNIRNA